MSAKKSKNDFEPVGVSFVSPSYQGYFINSREVNGGELAEVKTRSGKFIRGKIVVETEGGYLMGISIRHMVSGEESVMNIIGKLVRLV